MAEVFPSIAQCAIVSAAFKILLFPTYKSTDFEVHRNWLAVTYSLPIKQWYYEDTSEWTLDYPPFFAYFEWLLSQGARWVDPAIVRIQNLKYDSWQAVYFQRMSVIVTELVLVYALQLYVNTCPPPWKRAAHAAALSILLSPGLLLIDHIHFQYNGLLYGILILSLTLARKQNTLLWSGILFAILLCMKHIYLYLAPAYFVYLLRTYCLDATTILDFRYGREWKRGSGLAGSFTAVFGRSSLLSLKFGNLIKLGSGVLTVFGVAFGPFIYWGQINQLLSRLFPFSRGLCHAYWAPNIWALYSFADRLLLFVAPKLSLRVNESAVESTSRGLVGDTSFAVLPEISPRITFILTLFFQMVCLVKLFSKPTWDHFVGAVTLCGYASFLFGWHVHEKAILLVIIPFTLLAVKDRRHLRAFAPLAVSGHVSLLPLLFTPAEFPIKTVYTIFWLVVFLATFNSLDTAFYWPRINLLDRLSRLYYAASIPLILYCSVLHRLILDPRYEFLPLMLISTYSALGVVSSWLGFLVIYLTS